MFGISRDNYLRARNTLLKNLDKYTKMSNIERLTANEFEKRFVEEIIIFNDYNKNDIIFKFEYDYKLASIMLGGEEYFIDFKFYPDFSSSVYQHIRIKSKSLEFINMVTNEVVSVFDNKNVEIKDLYEASQDLMNYSIKFLDESRECYLDIVAFERN